MKPLLPFFFAFLFAVLGCYCSIGQCNVHASFTPGNDSLLIDPGNISYINTSSGAARYEWRNTGSGASHVVASTRDYSSEFSTPGVYAITLTAIDGPCRDSVSTKVIVRGSQPPGPEYLVHIGHEGINETAVRFMIPVSDGGYLVGAGIKDVNSYTYYYLIKVSVAGYVEWSHRIQADINLLTASGVADAAELPDGSFVTTVGAGGDGQLQSTVMRFSSKGRLLWSNRYSAQGVTSLCYSLVKATKNGVILAGNASDNSGKGLVMVASVDSSGNTLWARAVTALDEEVPKGLEVIDNDVYVAGSYISEKYTYGWFSTGTMLKANISTGAFIWRKRYTAGGMANFNPLKCFAYKNQLLVNYTATMPGNGFLLMDGNGNITASHHISGYSIFNGSECFAQPFSNGKDLLVFTTGKETLSLPPYYNNHSILTKLDENGRVVWGKDYRPGDLTQFTCAVPGVNGQAAAVMAFSGVIENVNRSTGGIGLFTAGANGETIDCHVINYQLPLNNYGFQTFALPLDIGEKAIFVSGRQLPLVFTDDITSRSGEMFQCPMYYPGSCNFLKLKGSLRACNLSQKMIYTGVRSPGCFNPLEFTASDAAVTLSRLTDSTVSAEFARPGTYHIKVKLMGTFNVFEDSLTIEVTDNKAFSLGGDIAVCQGITPRLSAGPGYTKYEWQDGTADSFYVARDSGYYSIKVTDSCGWDYKDTLHVIYNSNIPLYAGPDVEKCNTDTLVLTAPDGYVRYEWAPEYGIAAVNRREAIVFPQQDTFYTVTVYTENGCTGRDTIQVKYKSSPIISLGADTSLCAGDTLKLHAGSGFATYRWNTGDNQEMLAAVVPGKYVVKATSLNGCISQDSLLIKDVYSLPVSSLGRDTALCNGQELSFQFSHANAEYMWSTGSVSSGALINTAGIYWLQVTQQHAQHYCRFFDTVVVDYKSSATVTLGIDTTLCEGTTLTLDATYPGAEYRWQDGTVQPSYVVEHEGLYYVTTLLNNCLYTDSIQVTYLKAPVFSLGRDTAICTGMEITLRPMPTPVGEQIWTWYNGSNSAEYVVAEPGRYWGTASNICGTYTDTILITKGLCELILPSAFTPNNDGLNDIFRIKTPFPVRQFHMVIYNRWGQQVFISNDIATGWNGYFKGIAQPPGSYVWKISIIDREGQRQNAQGMITLIR